MGHFEVASLQGWPYFHGSSELFLGDFARTISPQGTYICAFGVAAGPTKGRGESILLLQTTVTTTTVMTTRLHLCKSQNIKLT